MKPPHLLNTIVTTIILLSVPQFVTATNATPLEIYNAALENDPVFNTANIALSTSLENKRLAYSGLYPEIDLTAEVGRNREEVETSGVGASGVSYFDNHRLQLKLKQPLYRKDIFSNIDISESEYLIAENEYRAAKQELIISVLDAYFNVLSARDNNEYTIAEKDAINKQLHNIKRRHRVGKSTITDLQEVQASYDLAIAQTIIAADEIDNAFESLTQHTGVMHDSLASLSHSFLPVQIAPLDQEHWVSLARKNNPTLLARQYNIHALTHAIEKQKAGHYPKLDLVAQHRTEETGGRFGESDTDDNSISLKLAIPIYKGGQINSKIRTARLDLDAAKLALMKTQRTVIRETRSAYRSLATSINRIKALKLAVKSSETALASITKGYKVGTRTSADVLDSQSELFRAKRDFSLDQYNYIRNYLNLKSLAGSLSISDIEVINEWFN